MINQPFAVDVDSVTGVLQPERGQQIRRLGDLAYLFADPAAAKADPDREVYRTSTAPGPAIQGHLGLCLTTIRPGCVAGELHMTHGHVHRRPEGEVYLGLTGHGGVVLSHDGRVRWLSLGPAQVVVIPPDWIHRSINTGRQDFVFLSVFPALSGTNYEPVRLHGAGARVHGDGSAFRVEDLAGRQVHTGRNPGL